MSNLPLIGDLWTTLGTLKGPLFALSYLFLLMFLLFATVTVRMATESSVPTWIGLLIFESVGAARYFAGTEHGMHRWGFTTIMMLAALVLFNLKYERRSGYGSSSNGYSCGGGGTGGGCSGGAVSACSSSAASCGGGGGCGGGGCGGCGGS
jgi:hypothetical protein